MVHEWYDALQVRARTSAGYGAFSRRFEFQTSPYCEYTKEKERMTIQWSLTCTQLPPVFWGCINNRCQVWFCVCVLCVIPCLVFGSNCYKWACSSFDSSGGHHTGSGPAGSGCWIPAQWAVRHNLYTCKRKYDIKVYPCACACISPIYTHMHMAIKTNTKY